MKRLTKRDGKYMDCLCENCEAKNQDFCDCGFEVWARLKQYEDAEEQGLLVRLPCKVGDTVWFRTYKNGERVGIKPHRVEKIKVLAQLERGYAEPLTEIQEWDFGKTVFLTREEAEKALEDA